MNPALTAMANALRVGDHLLERLGASAGRPTTSPAHAVYAAATGAAYGLIAGRG